MIKAIQIQHDSSMERMLECTAKAGFKYVSLGFGSTKAFHQDNWQEVAPYIKSKLEENGLTYGFATYWHAGRYTVLSDGDVEINGIILGGDGSMVDYFWLNDMERYTEEAHSGESFLMLTREENGTFYGSPTHAALGEPVRVLEHGDYIIYVYGYNLSSAGYSAPAK